ncbi:MAG: type I restriction-modification system subunit M N-terminal domain-containing protein, partial [Leptotrichiaceae bacterium]|nr:type I restriction-modification system subunit M N-terminal domain-containing protein [Leptotrichiaceae bacterium]
MADMQEIEKKLWEAADKMRNNMDPAEYKHVVLGLIFLKYISDRFEAQYQMIKNDNGDVEDKDEYTAEGVFFVPEKARWENIKKASPLPSIGEVIDEAMLSIEKENSQLQGV